MEKRLQYQLDTLERALLTDDLTEREWLLVTTLAALFRDTGLDVITEQMFKGNQRQAVQFIGIMTMHLNRGPGRKEDMA